MSWSYRELLAGIHQTANLLHSLGLAARRRRHPAARLPGIPPGAMGRRGGLRGAAAESAAIRGQAGGAAERHRRARPDRLRRRGRLRILDQALRLRERVPAQPAARRADGRTPSARPARGLQRRARRHAGRPAGQRPSHPGQRRGRLFPYGRHHRRAQAGHPHANQVFTAWAAVHAKRRPRRRGHQRLPLFHVAGALPASLAALSAGVATIIPTTQLRNREVLRNYWRLIERHRATSLACRPSWRRWPRCRWTARTFPRCATAAPAPRRCRPNWPRASSGNSACTSTKAWA